MVAFLLGSSARLYAIDGAIPEIRGEWFSENPIGSLCMRLGPRDEFRLDFASRRSRALKHPIVIEGYFVLNLSDDPLTVRFFDSPEGGVGERENGLFATFLSSDAMSLWSDGSAINPNGSLVTGGSESPLFFERRSGLEVFGK